MTNRKSVGKCLQLAKDKLYSFICDAWTPILINKMQLSMSTLRINREGQASAWQYEEDITEWKQS